MTLFHLLSEFPRASFFFSRVSFLFFSFPGDVGYMYISPDMEVQYNLLCVLILYTFMCPTSMYYSYRLGALFDLSTPQSKHSIPFCSLFEELRIFGLADNDEFA